MILRDNRTMLALILTALAVIVPCVAWYLVGSREAERQVADLADTARQSAHDAATRLADQLTQRLNTLRDVEARRPFYHYQPFFHDPKGASEGASVVPSPLAAPPGDPLVQVYFQADGESGRVSLPAANVEAQQQLDPQAASQRDTLRYLQHELERGLASILFAVRGESRTPNITEKNGQQESAPAQGKQVMTLDQRAWQQNAEASELYTNLKRRKPNTAPQQLDIADPEDSKTRKDVQITVGALKWRTLYVSGQPALVALREVTTPQGVVLQGFLIAPAGVDDLFRASGLPAHLSPGKAITDLQVAVGTGDEPWHVSIDPRDALAGAERQAHDLRRGFLTIFLGGAAIAFLCGLGVVWLVWQTERLASQRAQFAASAAHELRTPLAGLRIFSDMLAEGLGDPAKSKDYARRVSDEAGRLGRVVTNVLGFTRLERGIFTAHPALGDLAATVRESVERQKPAFAAAGASIELVIAHSLPPVKFDGDAVGQIIQNLLDNAEKHTRQAANRTIRVEVGTTPHGVELTVTDHGPGVPPHVRRRLFEAFTRSHDTDAPAGLGLGLVIVKALSKAQDATVSYRDNEDGGARFTVTFSQTA
ncbi:MAG: HAMP domain-containing sensor histidine kinase [bacterium]